MNIREGKVCKMAKKELLEKEHIKEMKENLYWSAITICGKIAREHSLESVINGTHEFAVYADCYIKSYSLMHLVKDCNPVHRYKRRVESVLLDIDPDWEDETFDIRMSVIMKNMRELLKEE